VPEYQPYLKGSKTNLPVFTPSLRPASSSSIPSTSPNSVSPPLTFSMPHPRPA
jgi:hypothetical protein